jgi:hypothetical protein
MFGFFDDFMFSIAPIFIFIIFIVVIAGLVIAIVKGIKEWNYNNSQPILSVEAKIVGKREEVHRHNNNNNNMHYNTSTTYYVTFEVESGDRMEFNISGKEYGFLVENDTGKLTFQGTRYLGFERYV